MKRFFNRLFTLVFIGAILWFTGLLWFIHIIPDRVEDTTTITDGIVALTGGSNRLATAVTLLKEKKAKKLLITGVGPGITLPTLGTLDDIRQDDISADEGNIVLGYIAKDTRQNAQEAAIWASLEDFKSIRIVTSNYHIPRSILEFSHAMPNVTLVPHPVFPSTVKVKDWWFFPGSTRLIISEYHKYTGSYLQHYTVDTLHSFSQWVAGYIAGLGKGR